MREDWWKSSLGKRLMFATTRWSEEKQVWVRETASRMLHIGDMPDWMVRQLGVVRVK